MRALVNIFTAASLLIHAMIGCCHHCWHDEACETAAISAPVCSCCQHGAAPQESDSLPMPCSGKHECQGVCTYLSTLKPSIEDSQLHQDCVPFLHVPSHECVCSCDDVDGYREHPDLGASPPHLRLHLLNQILLI